MPGIHPLARHLVESSSAMARESFDVMVSRPDSAADGVLRAGMSAELLLRAVVADVAPGLVMGGRDEARRAATMMRAQLRGDIDISELLAQKSASFEFVRAAAKEVVPEIGPLFSAIDTLMNARNAAAHLYVADEAALRGNLTVLANLAAVLLGPLRIPPEEFWGPHLPLADMLVEENTSAIRASVTLKLAESRLVFERLISGLDADEVQRVLISIEQRGMPFISAGAVEFNTECPVCRRRAELWVRAADYMEDFSALEIQWDLGENEPTGFLVPQEVMGVRLLCPVCGLHLTEEEVRDAYPELADDYELEPRLMSVQEYDEYLVLYDPT